MEILKITKHTKLYGVNPRYDQARIQSRYMVKIIFYIPHKKYGRFLLWK